MSNYRRVYIPGGTYFFTVVTYNRQPIFADNAHVELLRQSIKDVKNKRPFDMVAAVILPDHLHCLWTLPENDADFSTRWQMIKTAFSRKIPTQACKDGSKTIWQPRFYDHLIRDENDFNKHLDYIHYNPVKHKLAISPITWPYSSFAKFLKLGWYEENWGEYLPDYLKKIELE